MLIHQARVNMSTTRLQREAALHGFRLMLLKAMASTTMRVARTGCVPMTQVYIFGASLVTAFAASIYRNPNVMQTFS